MAHVLWPYSGCFIREWDVPNVFYCFEFSVWRFFKGFILTMYLKGISLFIQQWTHTVVLLAGLPSHHRGMTTPRISTPGHSHQLTGLHTCKEKRSSLGILAVSLNRGDMLTDSKVRECVPVNFVLCSHLINGWDVILLFANVMCFCLLTHWVQTCIGLWCAASFNREPLGQ
jgi:hypothetical protein